LRTTCACYTTGNRNPKKFTFAICRLRITIYNNRRAYDIITAGSHFRPLRIIIYLYRVTVCFFARKHISVYHFRKSCGNLLIIVLFPHRNHCAGVEQQTDRFPLSMTVLLYTQLLNCPFVTIAKFNLVKIRRLDF